MITLTSVEAEELPGEQNESLASVTWILLGHRDTQ